MDFHRSAAWLSDDQSVEAGWFRALVWALFASGDRGPTIDAVLLVLIRSRFSFPYCCGGHVRLTGYTG